MHAALLFVIAWILAAGGDLPAPPKTVKTPGGQTFKLVPRDQLRVKTPGVRTMRSAAESGPTAALPTPPAGWDFTKANTVSFPILGNDRVGDCFLAAVLHLVQTWCGMNGKPAAFDATAVVKRYLAISNDGRGHHGDYGLDDATIFPEFKAGVLGPNGPHRILDYMLVKPSDAAGLSLAGWAFGGWLYTCGLCEEWQANSRPGATWDAGHSDPRAGHAMLVNGRNADGTWKLQTWGFNPPVRLTQKGLMSADPECVVCFSLEWYDPATGLSPAGRHYTEDAELWVALGGRPLPPSPFPPKPGPGPTPDPGPAPAPPAGTVTVQTAEGAVVIDPARKAVTLPKGWAAAGDFPKSAESQMRAAGVSPAVIADVLKLLADVTAKAPRAVVIADVFQLMTDVTAPPKAMPSRRAPERAPRPRLLPSRR